MFLAPIQDNSRSATSEMPALLDQLARTSTRPRYAFMVLGLIAELAKPDGSAGPFVMCNGASMLLRDWLCDALTPMGCRDPKRQALAIRIRDELAGASRLPEDHAAAEALVEAGLVSRHYRGTFVDHRNRGAQRHVVYTLTGRSRCLLSRNRTASTLMNRQDELLLA